MDWTQIVTVILNSLIIPMIIYGIKMGVDFLKDKSKNEKIDSLISRVGDIVVDAVEATNQTFVDSIKGTDKWTEETMKEAFNKSMQTVKATLGVSSLNLLSEVVGDVDTYIQSKIESWVKSLKNK